MTVHTRSWRAEPRVQSGRESAGEHPTSGANRGARTLAYRYAALVVAVVIVATVSLATGTGEWNDAELRPLFLQLRATRLGAAFLAGAGLAIGGVLVQGVFRNPLASPSILGTTAGASLGGRSALLLQQALLSYGVAGWIRPEMILPLGCVGGAIGSLLVLLAFIRQGADRVTLLLTGFILSALFMGLGSFLTSLAQQQHELGRAVVAFTLGGVGGVGVRHVLLAVPLVLTGGMAAWLWARPLDLLLSGEDEAASLGVDVTRVRRWCVVWASIVTAAAVAIGGNVGFVGLVVPHALRPFFGVGHRRLVGAAALAGGGFLIACDVLTRLIPSQSEIPLGVVTSLIGAPVFLVLLIRSQRGARHV